MQGIVGQTTICKAVACERLPAQLFDGMSAGLVPFSKAIYPKSYPFVRLIKDHVAHPHYLNDRAVLSGARRAAGGSCLCFRNFMGHLCSSATALPVEQDECTARK